MSDEEKIEKRVLAAVDVRAADDSDIIGLILTDTEGVTTEYLVKPKGWATLLIRALEVASQWAEHSESMASHLDEMTSALPAQGIRILPGRDATECAVHIFLERIELTFLIPLDDVINATHEMVEMIDKGSGQLPH